MRKLWKKKKIYTPVIIVGLVSLMLFLENFKTEEFFKASFIDIVTIFITGCIASLFAETMTDERRKNDCIEHIILEIESIVSNEDVFSPNRVAALSQQRSCANRIKYLNDAKFQEIQEGITFIANQFDVIRELYSNHESNLDAVMVDFKRSQGLICDKCNKIRLGLYC